jgi:chromosome segregation ATPase
MTLKDLEQGFELHEKRLERVDQRLDRLASTMESHDKHLARVDQGLDRLASSMESHDKRLTRVEDNLAVQGELLNRVDQRLDRLAEMFVQSEGGRAEDRERMRLMQAAMTALFQRMDAFIRGLERRDGHQKPGGE